MAELYFNVEINNDYFRERNILDRNMRNAVAEDVRRDGAVTLRNYRLPAQEGDSYLSVCTAEDGVTDRISRIHTEITAHGEVLVNGVSSLYLRDLEMDGNWWNDKDRLSVWVCRNSWCGEGQWQELTLAELGVFPKTFGVARFSSQGTWTTAYQHPLVILCDKKKNVSYCFESEAAAGRYLEIGTSDLKNKLYVYVSSANEKQTGWHRQLRDGETFVSEPVAYGAVEGGFEEAIAAMIEYKRKTSLVTWKKGYAPTCFNDYMNCLWAQPTREKLLPLIAAAAEAGIEIFCIDAGWFGNWHDPKTGTCGHWVPDDTPFGEEGLQGIINEIRASGMIPGLWLELECVLAGAPFFREHPEYLLTRHGVKIHRDFPDFRLPAVREYLSGQIDDLVVRGVGYFKNDYNANLGIGCDSLTGGTLQDGAKEYSEAFLSFIDETLARHPGLIIENCGSGALCSDNHRLAHFALQSITDHMDYENMPSIIQGSLAQMPPEKAGIWAYPYPLRDPGALKRGKTLQEAVSTDEAQTVCNLAGGLFGCFYLSGRIDLAEGDGKALLKQAVDLYKRIRPWTCKAFPIYPDGMLQMLDPGVAVFGLWNQEAKKMLLGVFGSVLPEQTEKTLDLSKYCGDGAKIAAVFTDREVSYTADLPTLSVTLPAGCHAVALEIDL